MDRRLTRDTKNAVLGGVAAGFADYFGVDPVLVRLVFILLTFLNGFGLVAYAVGWVIMPRREEVADAAGQAEQGRGPAPAGRIVEKVRQAGDRLADEFQRLPRHAGRGRVVAGSILIVVGTLFLLDRLSWLRWPHWARLANLWPVILIAVGASLILEAARGRRGH